MSDTYEQPVEIPRDREQELVAAKEAMAGPVPLIPEHPNGHVTLPRGFLYNGVQQTKAEVRELTGADEEILARTKEFADYFDTMIGCGTIRLGDLDLSDMPVSDRRGSLQTLLIGERERLFLAIVQATYGDTKTIPFTCGNCQAEQEVDLILSEDLKVKEVDDIRLNYSYTTSKGDHVDFRLVNGADQMAALRDTGANNAEQNTTILSRCITKVNDGLVPDPVSFARRMTMKDRKYILDTLVAHQPGVDLEVTLTCVRCQNEQKLLLGWVDLFQT